MKTPPTLREIARRAGCSHITVSRALRGAPGVSEKRAARIRELADEMGFETNPLVAAWMRHIRKGNENLRANLALLSGFSSAESKKHKPTVEIFRGAESVAKKMGSNLTMFSPEDLSARAPHRQLIARAVQGVLVGPAPYHTPCPAMDWGLFSVVALGRSYPELRVDRVASDSFGTMQHALDLAAQLGADSPVLILDPERDERLRFEFSAAFLQKAPTASRSRIFPWTGQAEKLKTWLGKRQPGAIVCTEHSALPHLTQNVPVIVLGGPDPGKGIYYFPRDFDQLGVAAMEALSAKVIRNERGLSRSPRTILIEELTPTRDRAVSRS